MPLVMTPRLRAPPLDAVRSLRLVPRLEVGQFRAQPPVGGLGVARHHDAAGDIADELRGWARRFRPVPRRRETAGVTGDLEWHTRVVRRKSTGRCQRSLTSKAVRSRS